jgi:hypothetical protein
MPVEGFPKKKRTHKKRKERAIVWRRRGERCSGPLERRFNSRKKRWESDRPICW